MRLLSGETGFLAISGIVLFALVIILVRVLQSLVELQYFFVGFSERLLLTGVGFHLSFFWLI